MITIPNWLEQLGAIWEQPLFLVGGLVRNWLLDIEYGDIDIASKLMPDEVFVLLEKNNAYKVIPKKPELGTVEIHFYLDGKTYIAEHTTFRSEVYFEDGSHNPKAIAFSKSLEEDAFRRDFTVNAIYINVLTKELLDPTGGLRDLENGVLRATSPNPEIILKDDALRILRLVRFAAMLDFSIEKKTLAAAQKFAPNLKDISAERKQKELIGLLLCDMHIYKRLQKDNVLLKGLNLLKEMGAWEFVLPLEAFNEKNIERASTFAPDLTLRFAALLPTKELFEKALGSKGLKLYGVLKELKKMHSLKEQSKEKIEVFLPALALAPKDIAKKAAILFGGETKTALERIEHTHAPRSYSQLALTSQEIIQITGAKGREIGEIQRALFAFVVLEPMENTKEILKQRLSIGKIL